MPSFFTRHGDAPALRRVRELFRKKQDEDGDAAGIRELLQNDRARLLRDIEQILQGHKSSENLAPLKEVRTLATYCSTASQTEPEEEPQLASSEPDDTAAAVGIYTYTSSSTQTDRQEVEETIGSPNNKLPALGLPLLAGNPASTVPRSPPKKGFPLDKATKATEDKVSPKPTLSPAPIGQTRSSQSLASQHVANNPLARSTNGGVTRYQKHGIDDKTGTILLWKWSKVGFKGQNLIVRLPPQRFTGPAISNTSEKQHLPQTLTVRTVHSASEKPQQLSTASKIEIVARDICEMRQSLQALQDGGQWAAIDDEDEGADGDDEDVDMDGKDTATKRHVV